MPRTNEINYLIPDRCVSLIQKQRDNIDSNEQRADNNA